MSAMVKWYLYDYVYNDTISEYQIEGYKNKQTQHFRWIAKRNFIEVTNKPIEHLNAAYTGTYEMVMYYLDYLLHLNGKEDTFTFMNKDLWDLYDKNLKKYEKEFEDQSRFDLINKLSHIVFESESFSIEKPGKERKNQYVYFLKKNEEIVYVGQTQATYSNRTNRPVSHTDKDFDSFDMIQIDDSMDLDLVESYYIIKHKPKYNKSLPVSKEWWNVIRFALKTSWSPYH